MEASTVDVAWVSNATWIAVLVVWVAFAGVFLARRRVAGSPERKRDRMGLVGLALQGVGYAVVWAARRMPGTPLVDMPLAAVVAVGLAAIGVALASFLLVLWAVQTLGRQWALAARVLEGHELVTGGPYRWIRNPIYAGMLGMLVATGVAVSQPRGLLVGVAVFLVGTVVRVKSEERLLREAFGERWADWARRTPALVPFVW